VPVVGIAASPPGDIAGSPGCGVEISYEAALGLKSPGEVSGAEAPLT